MNTSAIRSTLLSTLGVALALASGSALAISFRLTELTLPGGSFSRGSDLNESGQVTGFAKDGSDTDHAFLWDGTTMLDLGEGEGFAINDSGQVTGGVITADGTFHAFLWDGTVLHDLGALGGEENSSGLAINASGHVTGLSSTADFLTHAFLLSLT